MIGPSQMEGAFIRPCPKHLGSTIMGRISMDQRGHMVTIVSEPGKQTPAFETGWRPNAHLFATPQPLT
ncbi:13629_t:CDS:2 [Acaulospora colombiana]|uniref:13629_t:CDS:1 n=1 Tax=Acaulospora colombiana TaxID=27376 RepID=A0ACA9N1N6_9GLOM|nr:13629_t:CDS:2 [Acaulospora colombiana]